jgi:uncharacterized membrane protein
MAAENHIRNPIEWGSDQLKNANVALGRTGHAVAGDSAARQDLPAIRHIGLADLREVLRLGIEDFAACRTDVMFVCLIYPVAGLVLAQLAFGADLLPILFPLASGFALVGPVAAIGLYEMSRRREQGQEIGWLDAFRVLRSPAFGAILVLGIVLFLILAIWLGTAHAIYGATLGPEPPASTTAFVHAVLGTDAGWRMIGIGIGVGFLFALLVLVISVVSFPMLLDRDVGVAVAVATSARAVWANPVPMAAWGLIVAGALVLGSIPALLGLIFVMPILGHATWHLYRKVVLPPH